MGRLLLFGWLSLVVWCVWFDVFNVFCVCLLFLCSCVVRVSWILFYSEDLVESEDVEYPVCV